MGHADSGTDETGEWRYEDGWWVELRQCMDCGKFYRLGEACPVCDDPEKDGE